jgi:hypothetical protein
MTDEALALAALFGFLLVLLCVAACLESLCRRCIRALWLKKKPYRQVITHIIPPAVPTVPTVPIPGAVIRAAAQASGHPATASI